MILDTPAARTLCGFTKALTGARMLWLGCAPDATQRVYFGNHGSHGDFALIWACLPPELRNRTRPVAGADYWCAGALRKYVAEHLINAVLIDRNPETRTLDPIRQMADAIGNGDSLIVFPEGTRNTTEASLLPFKSGIYHLAHACPEVEFVPVWIENSRRVMPKGQLLPVPLLCTLSVGAPIKLQAEEDKDAFVERTRGALLALMPAEPMTMQQQTMALFAGIGAILVVSSLIGCALKTFAAKGQPNAVIDNLNARIKAWWVMVLVISGAFLFGKDGVIVLFLFISFVALREFMTLTYTRSGDHNALAASFFIVLPAQYFFIYIEWYGLYSIFIPIYAFLILPILEVTAGDTTRFLERAAKMQWGLMVCVFCISHVPALLTLDIPGYEGRNILLIVFLVLVVQSSDVLQYVWGKLFGRHKIAPHVSPSKTLEGLVGGVLSATALGAALWWITPFTVWQAALMALAINVMGFLGGLVMSAIKRDRGVKDWGHMIEGHGGMLDRLDSVVFAAPVFFHATRHWWAI